MEINTKKGFVIAIDGPVASGKGTIAPELAKRVNGFYLQTGAMYRAVALYCLQHSIPLSDIDKIIQSLPDIQVDFANGDTVLNGKNVTQELRREEVSRGSAAVAVIPEVRVDMVRKQKVLAREKLQERVPVVAEGRDTATRVFPHADVALFLTATPETRAKRRQAQIIEQSREEVSFEKVLFEVTERDKQDMERATDPLVREPEKNGYIVLDNSQLTEEETLDKIMMILKEKGLFHD